jgi:hypothetical protein
MAAIGNQEMLTFVQQIGNNFVRNWRWLIIGLIVFDNGDLLL